MVKTTKAKEKSAANGKHPPVKVKANGATAPVAKAASRPGKAAKAVKGAQAKAEPEAATSDKVATKTKAVRTTSPKAAKPPQPAKATRKRPVSKPGFFESFLKLFR